MVAPSGRVTVLSVALVLGGCGRAGYETIGTARDAAGSDAGAPALDSGNRDGTVGDGGGTDVGVPPRDGDVPLEMDAGLDAGSEIPPDAGTAPSVLDVCAGKYHSCAVIPPGEVWCWGENDLGQLGDGTMVAMRASPVRAGTIADAVQVACGMRHTCARHAGGTVSCWGWGASGQLGDGSNATRTTPGPVGGLTGAATDIAVGWANGCALIDDGTIQCWGYNNVGQLGDGTTMDRRSPITVPGITGAIGMANGGGHACAILSDGTMRCWGSNSSGKLGDGTTTDSLVPVTVVGVTNAVRAAGSPGHTCALLTSGRIVCWGGNSRGQLGNGTMVDRPTADDVLGITGGVAISVLGDVSCARTSGAELWCWGENGAGQLGDGTTITRTAPTRVSTLSGVVTSSAGETHSCAATASTVFCWGSNAGGKLGDGTTTASLSPVPVALP